jgi:hypothetical protein
VATAESWALAALFRYFERLLPIPQINHPNRIKRARHIVKGNLGKIGDFDAGSCWHIWNSSNWWLAATLNGASETNYLVDEQ